MRSTGKFHAAVDIMFPRQKPTDPQTLPWGSERYFMKPNTPALAANAGKIVASKDTSTGGLIRITHGDGLETQYLHLSSRYKKFGDTVQAGEKLGAIGWNPQGYKLAHLHFEIIRNGQKLNPEPFLKDWSFVELGTDVLALMILASAGYLSYRWLKTAH